MSLSCKRLQSNWTGCVSDNPSVKIKDVTADNDEWLEEDGPREQEDKDWDRED